MYVTDVGSGTLSGSKSTSGGPTTSPSFTRSSRDSGVSSANVIHIEKLRKRKENIPSIASSGSRPNNVGVHTTPDTRLVLSTKSMIWQSVLPVCGDKRIPLPICKIFINENYSRSKQLAPTICAYRFLDLVGFAITTQSMLGISVPSVKIAA